MEFRNHSTILSTFALVVCHTGDESKKRTCHFADDAHAALLHKDHHPAPDPFDSTRQLPTAYFLHSTFPTRHSQLDLLVLHKVTLVELQHDHIVPM